MNPAALRTALEAALFAAEAPLSGDALLALFDPDLGPVPTPEEVQAALEALARDCEGRAIELVQVASGWRYQVRQDHAAWVQRLHAERPGRYSRAAMETLAIIAYRQPVTRAEIEDIRGVAVSTNIIRNLLEREWVRVVGHRELPGRPAVYATTRQFLDYFGLRSLDQLPSLAELLPPELSLLGAVEAAPEAGAAVKEEAL
jgi:segregation and condensation protein B